MENKSLINKRQMLLATITIIADIFALARIIPTHASKMPSIFDRIGSHGSYHMMSEVELKNGNSIDVCLEK